MKRDLEILGRIEARCATHDKSTEIRDRFYLKYRLLIKSRTYSEESCSTVTSLSSSQTHSNLHLSGTNWSAIGGGSLSASKVNTNAGAAGNGAKQSFTVLHNGEEVRITL